MNAFPTGSIIRRDGDRFPPDLPVVANLRLDTEPERVRITRRPGPDAPDSRPPGSVLVVAALSAVSGAVMGLVFGGHLTVATAVLISVPVGVAVGMWVRGLTS
ncbi:hypothetical protein K9U40_08925 [Xanthobacter autotrophicus]|uniref:hypothetical protein n=1 Tax=Xanthobacter TaxID=279 RepID=UPI0024ABF6BB|nr:hypothetical protein [Xanthobacter autotrophicus]MDI4664445.1 hypothetical protein [Xanthobacter autotrophicus]